VTIATSTLSAATAGAAKLDAATAATPVTAAALKNLRLEGVFTPFNVLTFFDMSSPPFCH
jgi:hypothetical protein